MDIYILHSQSWANANPVNYIDPNGLDVWHINKSKAVGGQGHGGAIVGQGGNYSYHSFGPEIPGDKGGYADEPFDSLKDAMDFAKEQGYDRYARYPTSKEDDKRARERAKKWKDKDYHLTTSNCQDMVNDMMDATERYKDLWLDPNHPNTAFGENLPMSSTGEVDLY